MPGKYDPMTNYGGDRSGGGNGSKGALLPRQVLGLTGPQILDIANPVGVIQMFAGDVNTVPDNWLLCDGRQLNRYTYSRLFAVIGTSYGSISDDTFTLPNFEGRMPLGDLHIPFIAQYTGIGKTGGVTSTTHNHFVGASFDGGGIYLTETPNLPRSRVVAKNHSNPIGAANVGGNTREDSTYDETLDNMPPFLVINFIIKY